ncbi:hypothetical protein [Clostridium cadaveris]
MDSLELSLDFYQRLNSLTDISEHLVQLAHYFQ